MLSLSLSLCVWHTQTHQFMDFTDEGWWWTGKFTTVLTVTCAESGRDWASTIFIVWIVMPACHGLFRSIYAERSALKIFVRFATNLYLRRAPPSRLFHVAIWCTRHVFRLVISFTISPPFLPKDHTVVQFILLTLFLLLLLLGLHLHPLYLPSL